MEDGYSLFDYNIDLNCLVQVMIVPEKTVESKDCIKKDEENNVINDEKPALTDTVDPNNQENQEGNVTSESSSDTQKVIVCLLLINYCKVALFLFNLKISYSYIFKKK